MSVVRTGWVKLQVTNPLVAWLVYRGELVGSVQAHEQALSFWLMRSLKGEASTGHRSIAFQDEQILDLVRQVHFPCSVSRLRGLFVFDDQGSAERACQMWGSSFRHDAIAEVGILEGSRWSRHDAQWISARLGGEDGSWKVPYLRGEPFNENPIWEILVDGRVVVFGTRLREAAHQVVKREWPQSLALLELSRVAAELRSDLGVIVPMVFGVRHTQHVDFVMNMRDADSSAFLERFARYEGPKNTADLHAGSQLVLPDLRPHGFRLS